MTRPDLDIKSLVKRLVGAFEAMDVNRLHNKSDVDSQASSHHHTLGPRGFQASPGDHVHDGRTSRKNFGENPPAVTGAKGGNVALTNLLNQLDALGIIDNQTS